MQVRKLRYIHRGREPILNVIIYLSLLLEFGFFYLFSFPLEFYRWNSETSKYLLVGLTFLGVMIIMLTPEWQFRIKKFGFMKWYIINMIFMIFMMNFSAYIQYNVPIRDLFVTSLYLFYIFFSLMLLIKFSKDDNIDRFFSVCNLCFFIWLIICVLENIVYAYYGIHIVKNFLPDWFTRNGFVRMRFISICYLLIPYNFYRIISIKEKKYISIYIITFIALIMQLIIEGTRAYTIIILFSIIGIFLSDTTRNIKNKVIVICIMMGIILATINTTQFKNFIFSFSLSSNNRYIYSSINRVNEVVYYMEIFFRNPILALGNVPYSGDYNVLIKGPEGKFYLEDVGFFGLLAKAGISACLFYFTLVFRQMYILLNLGRKNKYFSLLIGFFVFTILSSATLIITDSQRIFLLPVIIAVFEFLFIKSKENHI